MGLDNPPEINPKASRPNWQEILIVLAVVAGLVLTVLFSYRLYHSVFTLHRSRLAPGTSDVNLIQGWMTVPYIARAYQVPEADLWQALLVPEQGNRTKNLNLIDHDFAGGKPGVMINRVKSAVLTYQTTHSPASPRSPTRMP